MSIKLESGRRMTIGLATAASVVCLASSGTAWSQVLVLQSSGPDAAVYPAGRILPSTRMIHLKQGDRLTVKVGDETRKYEGPLDVKAEPSASFIEVLRTLISQGTQSSGGELATRGSAGDSPELQNLWQVDISSRVDFCVSLDARPSLIRWTTQFPTNLVVDAGEGRPGVTVPWPARQSTLPWPESLPLTDGASYAVRVDDKDPVTVTWHRVEAPSSSLIRFTKQLVAKGCKQQLAAVGAGFDH